MKPKYAVLLGDGMADWPVEELGGKTPLEYAKTPHMDRIAARGRNGMLHVIPEGYKPGSDIGNMTVMGYHPKDFYTGRAPFEAASMGIELGPDDVAFRCNLVCLSDNFDTMRGYNGDHITTEEARPLIEALQAELGNDEFQFYPGVQYRHIMVWRGGKDRIEVTPPHSISDKPIADALPRGEGADVLIDIMKKGWDVLKDHPVNVERVKNGRLAANSGWFWGQGKPAAFPAFADKYDGKRGAVISAVDLVRGIGVLAKMEVLEVPGITGWLDTNYGGKVEYCLEALDDGADFVYVHVEAPDEAGHGGKWQEKVQAIEDFDQFIVGPIVYAMMERFDQWRVLVTSDHPTPLATRDHVHEPVPFAMIDADAFDGPARQVGYGESDAKAHGEDIRDAAGFLANELFKPID